MVRLLCKRCSRNQKFSSRRSAQGICHGWIYFPEGEGFWICNTCEDELRVKTDVQNPKALKGPCVDIYEDGGPLREISSDSKSVHYTCSHCTGWHDYCSCSGQQCHLQWQPVCWFRHFFVKTRDRLSRFPTLPGRFTTSSFIVTAIMLMVYAQASISGAAASSGVSYHDTPSTLLELEVVQIK